MQYESMFPVKAGQPTAKSFADPAAPVRTDGASLGAATAKC